MKLQSNKQQLKLQKNEKKSTYTYCAMLSWLYSTGGASSEP
jgi:hypothetical protein